MWLAQAAWLFSIVSVLYYLAQWAGEMPLSSNAWHAGRALVGGFLIVGLQRRMQLAAWATAGLFALSISMNSYRDLQLLMASTADEQAGQLIGHLVGAVVILMLPVRLVWGEPARAYFAGKAVRSGPSFEDG